MQAGLSNRGRTLEVIVCLLDTWSWLLNRSKLDHLALGADIKPMPALPQWLKDFAKKQRKLRLLQRRITLDAAREQCLKVERQSVGSRQSVSVS